MNRRVATNLAEAERLERLEGVDREAARLLFSTLADLEEIAVLAAERGDSIPGQYEDELVHRRSFQEIAEILGGKNPTPPGIQGLLDFLGQLHGAASLALINVTAETWLERTLHHLAAAGLCDGLFATIEADEARHAEHARGLPKPDPDVAAPLMEMLEDILADVTREPDFILPLMYFLGANECTRLALGIIEAHREACAHLELQPSQVVWDMRRTFREAARIPEPTPVKLDEWESLRVGMFRDQPGPMLHQFEVRWDRPYAEFEAELTRAASAALAELPRCNRTVARGGLYQCRLPLVGLRRMDMQGRVFTIYSRSPHRFPLKRVKDRLKQDAATYRRQPYCTLPDWRTYQDLMPPARAAAVITHVGAFGEVETGFAPLVPDEGPSLVLTTANVHQRPKPLFPWLPWLCRWEPRTTVNVLADHRAMDGRDIIAFSQKVKHYLETV